MSPSAVVSLAEGASLQPALGVLWDTEKDFFSSIANANAPMTKGGIFIKTSSLYDPVGFMVPFILKANILFELLRVEVGWDDVVNEDHHKYHHKRWL